MKLFNFKKKVQEQPQTDEETVEDDFEFLDEESVLRELGGPDVAEITIEIKSKKLKVEGLLHAKYIAEIENSGMYEIRGVLSEVIWSELEEENSDGYVDRLIKDVSDEDSNTSAWDAFDLSDR